MQNVGNVKMQKDVYMLSRQNFFVYLQGYAEGEKDTWLEQRHIGLIYRLVKVRKFQEVFSCFQITSKKQRKNLQNSALDSKKCSNQNETNLSS